MPELLTSTKRDLRIDVDYYNKDEEALLLQYPVAARIADTVSNGIVIPAAQFLTYYLYHRRRPGRPGYSTYYEISEKIDRAIACLEDWISLDNGTVNAATDAGDALPDVTEHIGEAIALSVVGQIHDLHEADWDKIPEHPGRGGLQTFDYEREVLSASDGTYVVQVEAKGASVSDSASSNASISTQKYKIKEKKKSISALERNGQYPYPATLRYGSISVVRSQGFARCLLVDPPRPEDLDPRRTRLLMRLQFMFDWISYLGSRSPLAASFATRLSSLQALVDPFLLDGVPLLAGDGSPFKLYRFGARGAESKLNSRLSHVTDGPAVGSLIRLQSGRFLFLGIQGNIYEMVADQDFDAVLKYRNEIGTVPKRIRCVVPRGQS